MVPPSPMASPAGNSVRHSRNDPSGTTASGWRNGKRGTKIACVFVTRLRPSRRKPSGTIRNERAGTSGGGRTRIACEFVTRPRPNFWEDDGEHICGLLNIRCLLCQEPIPPVILGVDAARTKERGGQRSLFTFASSLPDARSGGRSRRLLFLEIQVSLPTFQRSNICS